VHGMCGIWGGIATGLFASPAITEGAKGLFFGNPKQLWIQIISMLATAAYSAIGTIIVVFITKIITNGIRVDEVEEVEGLDQAIHGERAFEID